MRRNAEGKPVYLGGFMASGKTSVGRELSRLTGYPFLDMDEAIEMRTGMAVWEIFAELKEPAFRDLERKLLGEIASLGRCIAALGGGVLVDGKNRRLVEESGTLVILGVKPETAGKRAKSHAVRRPMLEKGDLEALWSLRRPFYEGGAFRVETDSLTPGQAAQKICEALGLPLAAPATPEKILEGTGGRVVVGEGILGHLPEYLGKAAPPFVVADALTGPLFAPRLGETRGLHLLPRGEEAKTQEQVDWLYRSLSAAGVDRSGTVAALGGGTVGDTAGFAAATWMRGVDLVQCPTTLLAQVDSAMGGKTGINLPEGKNLVGAFHQPVLVLSDVSCLSSLSWKDYRQGLAEMVKYGLGEDPAFFAWLEAHARELAERKARPLVEAIGRCAELKLSVVAQDEREKTGARARLNLGHTVAHALEAAGKYEEWQHGDAVAAGLVVAAHLAYRMGTCGEKLLLRLDALLEELGLPRRPDRPWEQLERYLARDKKFREGNPRLVIPVEGGPCALRDDVPLDRLRDSYEEVRNWRID